MQVLASHPQLKMKVACPRNHIRVCKSEVNCVNLHNDCLMVDNANLDQLTKYRKETVTEKKLSTQFRTIFAATDFRGHHNIGILED